MGPIDHLVAAPGPESRDQPVDQWIVDWACQKLQRIPVDGMRERAQFPRTNVRGQVEDASAAPVSFEIVVEPLVFDDFGDVVAIEFREVTEFHQQAPKVPEDLPDDPRPFVVGQIWKRHAKVVHAGFALPSGEAIAGPCDDVADPVGEVARNRSEDPKCRFCQCVLDERFSTHSHPCYFHILSR